jgi:hypothetical protein
MFISHISSGALISVKNNGKISLSCNNPFKPGRPCNNSRRAVKKKASSRMKVTGGENPEGNSIEEDHGDVAKGGRCGDVSLIQRQDGGGKERMNTIIISR